MKSYDHKKIEKKWQKEWQAKKTYKTLPAARASGKKPFYVLDMFPYPSGAGLHVGHPRGYIGSDVVARKARMEGYNVLHPMGYDAFGLPAEQYAIANKIHPRKAVLENVKTFERQLSIIGFSYDWSRKVNTTDPDYYHWTQWIFLKIYESWFDTTKNKARPITELVSIFEKKGNADIAAASSNKNNFTSAEWKAMSPIEQQSVLMDYRLAYEGNSLVNWCPELGTVLANDEIVDSPSGPVSERGGYPVEKRSMRQWFMRITAYADRLISDLADLDWPEHIKEIQRNWIGKSEGLLFSAPVRDTDIVIETFSAHFEACYADTFVVIAPDHPLLPRLVHGLSNAAETLEQARAIVKKKEQAGDQYKEIEGVFTGRYIVDPLGNGDLPIWVASFALKDYGTGIVKCSAHDARDFDFAKKYNIPLKAVLLPTDKAEQEQVRTFEVCFSDAATGVLTEPKEFAGKIAHSVRDEIALFAEQKGFAKRKTSYKLRDAVFARQRYWGEPIPLCKDKSGIIHEVAEKKLPLTLPNVKSYEPTGTGDSPLSSVPSWMKGGYETNTMPGWAGSSWYFLRYTDPKNKKAFADEKELAYWFDKKKSGGVDVYVGGSEHATGHLLYSRFWHKVLFDYGLVPTEEPFHVLRNQGMILASDGRKMSKRWGNVINPDDIVGTYGADTLRLYEMFMGPFDASLPWSTESIIGSRRFIERVWRMQEKISNGKVQASAPYEMALHRAIKKVSEDIAGFSFNTAVSAMMICLNEMEKSETVSAADFKTFLQLLAPFAPHVTEELWFALGQKKSIHVSGWPTYDPKKLVSDTVTIVVQVNSKNKAELIVSRDITEADMKELALKEERVQAALAGATPKKIIYVPGRIVNIVI